MLDSEPVPLTEMSGARTVYLVFYTGRCHLYERISDRSRPVYVGPTADLSRRIREHGSGIADAKDRRVNEFHQESCSR